MSDIPKPDRKPAPEISDAVQEVQAVFASDAALQDAISRLTLAGFDRADLSLPAASPTPSEATPEAGAANPNTETDDRQMRTLYTSMAGSAAAMAAAGAVIATGGLAAPAVAAAAAAGLGAAAATHAASSAADKVQHDNREDAAAHGELVLSVRAPNPGKGEKAAAILREAGASRVEPVTRVRGTIQRD